MRCSPIRRLAIVAALALGLVVPAVALAGDHDHGKRMHPRAHAGIQYHGKHGSVFLEAPLVRRYRHRRHSAYFGRPGTVIIERRFIAPGYQWRGRGHDLDRHRFGNGRYGAKTLQCGPGYCVRIR